MRPRHVRRITTLDTASVVPDLNLAESIVALGKRQQNVNITVYTESKYWTSELILLFSDSQIAMLEPIFFFNYSNNQKIL